MNEQAWLLTKEVFQLALECAPEDRAKLFDAACADNPEVRAEVEALLKEHAEDEPGTSSAVIAPPASAQDGEGPGTVIDRYKLLERIGEGGFGVVYMAEQTEPVRRKVALKIIKLGMDTKQVIARFEAERQALAMMDHPNIARVLDAGATDTGRPYFAMELVKGIPITEYCDQATLPTEERLQLFTSVCRAVQYAHMKGVIHRDLKPSNLLVTLHDGEPVVKVIDFGIAKATGHRLTEKTLFTAFRQILGTPEYMAPEQAEMSGLDVDTRADVYSLGVLLYELLTGTRPLELETLQNLGYDEVVRMIREEEPQKPSTRVSTLGERLTAIAKHRRTAPKALGRIFHGDLDWIAMKALEKDRSRRYETASALAEDVRRYLAHLPVEAGRPSLWYRLRKYLRRHTVGVTAGSAVLAALLIGLVLALSGYAEAKDQRDAARESTIEANLQQVEAVAARESERNARLEAEENEVRARTEALKASTVVELLGDMLSSADPHNVKGPNYTLRQLLDDFDVGLGNRLDDQPEVECTLHQTMGSAYLGLGVMDTAERHLSRAMDLARGELQEDASILAECLHRWAKLQHARGRYAEAEGTLREELELLSWPGEESKEVADGIGLLGDVLGHLGRYGESEGLHRKALAMKRKVFGEEHPSMASSLGNLALVLKEQGKYEEATKLLRQSLETTRKLLGEEHPSAVSSLSALAVTLVEQGKYEEGERLHLEALETRRKLFGDEHPEVATSLNNLATVLWYQVRYEEAERLYRQALEMRRKLLGEEHLSVAESLGALAVVLWDQGKYEEAERLRREALELVRKLFGDEHPSVASSLDALAVVLWKQGKYAEAERLFRDALEMGRKLLGNEHPDVASSLDNLAVVLADQGKYAEAEVLNREALETKRKLLGDEHQKVATSLNNLAAVLWDQGKYEEAEALQREALEMARKLFGEEHLQVAVGLNNLAAVLGRQGKYEEAEELDRESLEMRRKLLGDRHPQVASSLNNLAVVLGNQGKYEESEGLLREVLEIERRLASGEHPKVATTLYNLAVVLGRQGKYAEAESLHRKALEMRRRLFRDEHPSIATSLNNLAVVLGKQGEYEEAERLQREALEMGRKLLGEEHRDVVQRVRNLAHVLEQRGDLVGAGRVLLDMGRFQEALPLLRRHLSQREESPSEDPVGLAEARILVGGCLLGQGELEQAEALLLEGFEGLQDTPEEARDQRIQAAAWLVRLYEAMSVPNEAERWRSVVNELDGEGAR